MSRPNFEPITLAQDAGAVGVRIASSMVASAEVYSPRM
jgi:hypothetical protein